MGNLDIKTVYFNGNFSTAWIYDNDNDRVKLYDSINEFRQDISIANKDSVLVLLNFAYNSLKLGLNIFETKERYAQYLVYTYRDIYTEVDFKLTTEEKEKIQSINNCELMLDSIMFHYLDYCILSDTPYLEELNPNINDIFRVYTARELESWVDDLKYEHKETTEFNKSLHKDYYGLYEIDYDYTFSFESALAMFNKIEQLYKEECIDGEKEKSVQSRTIMDTVNIIYKRT